MKKKFLNISVGSVLGTGTKIIISVILIVGITAIFRSCEKRRDQKHAERMAELGGIVPKTTDGYIVYDMLSGVTMRAGEERTFDVPLGTRIKKYSTEGKVVRSLVKQQSNKYSLKAETDAKFDLVWFIEPAFENRVKPR